MTRPTLMHRPTIDAISPNGVDLKGPADRRHLPAMARRSADLLSAGGEAGGVIPLRALAAQAPPASRSFGASRP